MTERITNEDAEMILSFEPSKDGLPSKDDFALLYVLASQLAADLLHAREERDKAVAMVREALELLKSHLADNPKQSELYCYCGLCKDTRAFLEKAREYAEE